MTYVYNILLVHNIYWCSACIVHLAYIELFVLFYYLVALCWSSLNLNLKSFDSLERCNHGNLMSTLCVPVIQINENRTHIDFMKKSYIYQS